VGTWKYSSICFRPHGFRPPGCSGGPRREFAGRIGVLRLPVMPASYEGGPHRRQKTRPRASLGQIMPRVLPGELVTPGGPGLSERQDSRWPVARRRPLRTGSNEKTDWQQGSGRVGNRLGRRLGFAERKIGAGFVGNSYGTYRKRRKPGPRCMGRRISAFAAAGSDPRFLFAILRELPRRVAAKTKRGSGQTQIFASAGGPKSWAGREGGARESGAAPHSPKNRSGFWALARTRQGPRQGVAEGKLGGGGNGRSFPSGRRSRNPRGFFLSPDGKPPGGGAWRPRRPVDSFSPFGP